jgi:hypothetical protein
MTHEETTFTFKAEANELAKRIEAKRIYWLGKYRFEPNTVMLCKQDALTFSRLTMKLTPLQKEPISRLFGMKLYECEDLTPGTIRVGFTS